MSSKLVVKANVPANFRTGIARRLVGLELDLLIFDRSPESLDQEVVALAPLVIHADYDLVSY